MRVLSQVSCAFAFARTGRAAPHQFSFDLHICLDDGWIDAQCVEALPKKMIDARTGGNETVQLVRREADIARNTTDV